MKNVKRKCRIFRLGNAMEFKACVKMVECSGPDQLPMRIPDTDIACAQ